MKSARTGKYLGGNYSSRAKVLAYASGLLADCRTAENNKSGTSPIARAVLCIAWDLPSTLHSRTRSLNLNLNFDKCHFCNSQGNS